MRSRLENRRQCIQGGNPSRTGKKAKLARSRNDQSSSHFPLVNMSGADANVDLNNYDPIQAALMEEMVILVDREDKVTGKATKKICTGCSSAKSPLFFVVLSNPAAYCAC